MTLYSCVKFFQGGNDFSGDRDAEHSLGCLAALGVSKRAIASLIRSTIIMGNGG
ncbi:MAG: hypothetical protein F6K24_49475 [Okeania sp. SIO2D1]|nr:hypothetical protein [Okeania sp. SIO2D1]